MGLADVFPATYLPRSDGANIGIDYAHWRVHAGYSWTATHKVTHGTTTHASVLFTTPAAGEYHMVVEVESDKGGSWVFTEAPPVSTTATGSTEITGLNDNRGSTNTDPLTIVHTPTLGATSGTVIAQHLNGSAGSHPASVTGGGAIARGERALAASTRYVVDFTAANATTTTIINMYYYKEA